MLYFAFASNLDPVQMADRCPSHRVVGLAELRDHRLVFPLFSQHWGGGVASVQHTHGQSVWGILYEVNDADQKVLDGWEGFRGPGDQHNVYDRDTLVVELTRADDGSFPRRVRAALYVARPQNPSPPTRRYLDAILRGAKHHHLPDEYVARLALTSVRPEEPAPATE